MPDDRTDMRSLAWRHGVVSVSALGGMIGPTVFTLPDGRPASPFHSAPWRNEPGVEDMDGLMAGLQGEWPCVPFGYPMPSDYPAEWPASIEEQAQVTDVHGFGSGAFWTFIDSTENETVLAVDYPEDHAVRRLERTISPNPDAPTLDISLTIHMRTASCEPIGLHGCFRLPRVVGGAQLEPGAFRAGRTHPGTVEPEAPIFAVNETFTSMHDVPGRAVSSIDATRLPFADNGEDLLQLDDCDGQFSLAMPDEGYRTNIQWDSSILPSVLLWYSNQGRSIAPWNNRHMCIGIEPVCSPFGLSPDMARADNPIAASGTPTCVSLSPTAPLTINYSIGVSPL